MWFAATGGLAQLVGSASNQDCHGEWKHWRLHVQNPAQPHCLHLLTAFNVRRSIMRVSRRNDPTPIVSPAHHCKSGILLPTCGRIGPHSRTPRLKAILGASSSKISYECFIVAPRRRSGGCLPRT